MEISQKTCQDHNNPSPGVASGLMNAVKHLLLAMGMMHGMSAWSQAALLSDTLEQVDVVSQYRSIQSQITEAYQEPADIALWSGEDLRSLGPAASMTVSRDGLPSAYFQVELPSGPVIASDLGVVDLNTLPIAGMNWATTRHDHASRHLRVQAPASSELHFGVTSIGSRDGWMMLRFNAEDFVQLGVKHWDMNFPYRDYLGRDLQRIGNDGSQYTMGTQVVRQYDHIKWRQVLQWTDVDRGIPASSNAAYTLGARQQDERVQWLSEQSWNTDKSKWSIEQTVWRSDQDYQYDLYEMLDTNGILGGQMKVQMKGSNATSAQGSVWGRHERVSGMNKLEASQWLLGASIAKGWDWKQHQVNASMQWLQRDFDGLGYLIPKVDWQLNLKSAQMKSSIERLMRYPTMNDRFWTPGGQADLLPELGWQGQSEWAWHQRQIKMQIRGFAGYFSQGIMWLPGPGNIWRPENVYELSRLGSELVWSGSNWTAAYRWIRSVNSSGQHSPYVTPHILRMSGKVPLTHGELKVQGVYHAATPTSWSSAPILLDPFTRWDAHYKVELASFKIQLSVINALNSPYAFQLGYPMPGRHYQFTINYLISHASD